MAYVRDGPWPEPGGTADPAPQPVAANVEPQPVVSPLTGAAIFLVAQIGPVPQHAAAVRDLCADLAGLIRAVGFRDLDGHLTCVTGFGAHAWDRLAPGRLASGQRPAGLHPFREIRAGPGTPCPPPATCSSTSGPRGWTCASSWPPRSPGGSAAR